jgi:hypothetical protein
MKKKNEIDTLNETIVMLQKKRTEELKLLKEQFYLTYESLKPINFIKSTFREVTSSPNIKNNLLNNIIGLTTGFLSKKVIIGTTNNPIKKYIGVLLQFAITNIVSKHSDIIKSAGGNLLNRILKYNSGTKQEFSHNGNASPK